MTRLRHPVVGLAGLALAAIVVPTGPGAQAQPTHSSPIALSHDDTFLWVVNPNDEFVTLIDTATNQPTARFQVIEGAQSIAISPDDRFAFIANAIEGSVTVLRISPLPLVTVTPDEGAGPGGQIITGAEPWSVVVSPDSARAFVANSAQDTITVIQISGVPSPRVIGNVPLGPNCLQDDPRQHFQPRGLAVTADSTKLYTARFLSFTSRRNGQQGNDRGKVGVVCRLDIDTSSTSIAGYQPAQQIQLKPRSTGFQFPGFAQVTAAFPNQLQSIVIRGNRAYLPNIAASPSAPLRFNVDTHAFVSSIRNVNAANQTDGGALNLHLGARDPEGEGAAERKRLFFANPWAIAFTNQSGAGNAYVVSAASDLLVKLNVNASGTLRFTEDQDTTRYIDLNDPENPATAGANAGKNPRGIVINAAGTLAYVANLVSSNVSVVDLTSDQVIAVVPINLLPIPGSELEELTVGAEVFFSSRGNLAGGKTERLSSEGWQACSSCHFEGLTDGVVWVFGAGPRKSVPLNATFNPANRDEQRILNYSAIFDEVQDFELNIRNVSGPGPLAGGANDPNHGLLVADNGDINGAPAAVNAFTLPSAGRPQLTVTLPGSNVAVPALEALRTWVRFAVRTPTGPLDRREVQGGVNPSVIARGRRLFDQAGCDACHGGSHWTKSFKDFVSPPAANRVFVETDDDPAVRPNPVGTQYLDEFLEDIGSFNIGVRRGNNPIGRNVGAPELANAVPNAQGQLVLPDALGTDHDGDGRGDGYNVPSLLGIYASPPYLHNGACETILCVLADVEHRTAGNPTDVLNTAAKRNQVARFVESIDTGTQPFN